MRERESRRASLFYFTTALVASWVMRLCLLFRFLASLLRSELLQSMLYESKEFCHENLFHFRDIHIRSRILTISMRKRSIPSNFD